MSGGTSRRAVIGASLVVASAACTQATPSLAQAICARSARTDSGPFYPRGEIPLRADLTAGLPGGRLLYVIGAVRDAQCRPAPTATITLWQADHNGRYDHPAAENGGPLDPNFRYFGRLNADANGAYRIKTIVPAPYRFRGLNRAPHIHFSFGREASPSLVTELYFDTPADAERRQGDFVWQSRDGATRDSMIVGIESGAGDAGAIEPDAVWCRYDITLPA